MTSMAPETQKALDILNPLADELAWRDKQVKQRLDYYRGKHPLCYASPEFRDYFATRFEGFSDNWCQPVVQSPAERMNVLGVRVDGETREVDKDLARVWRSTDGQRGSSEAFVIALATGRSFASVWGDLDDEDTPQITWERPDQAIVAYDADRRRRRASLKLWRDEKFEYATLSTPDKVWKFQRSSVTDGRLRSGLVVPTSAVGGWAPRRGAQDDTWPLPNPMGVVPMVELQNHTLLDECPLSDIDGVIAMQDAINLVWAYLMNALDYASLPQRIVTGAEIPTMPVLDENGQEIGRRPIELDTLIRERILWIPGDQARTAEWTAANLDVYSQVIERAVEHIAAQTRTPPHYLIGKVANLSAEALTAAETGLVSKTGERITYFSPAIREVFRLVALAQGDKEKAKAVRAGNVVWADSQFRALGQKVDALQKLHAMGFPFEWIAEQYGLEPQEVQRVLEMKAQEAQNDPLAEIGRQLGGTGRPDPTPTVEPEPAAA